MALGEIQAELEKTEQDLTLFGEKNFDNRIEAIDFIEFHIIGCIESLLPKAAQSGELMLLKSRAEKVKFELEEIDTNLFQRLRENIRLGKYSAEEFHDMVHDHVDFNLADDKLLEQAGYDNLDIFINGLLSAQGIPEQTKALEPEMVFYQKTPARIIFELVEKVQFTKDDVFFDLGSGLGQVAILVNLLSGITTIGIEFEPAFCDYARDCAAQLNLSGMTFINTDAQTADYSKGTVFFMYTAFSGEMLQAVLELLRKESLLRKIKVITYGPCTAEVASQSWLNAIGPMDSNIYKLAIFSSSY